MLIVCLRILCYFCYPLFNEMEKWLQEPTHIVSIFLAIKIPVGEYHILMNPVGYLQESVLTIG